MLKNEFPRISCALECKIAEMFFSSLYSLSLLLVLVKNITKKEFPIKSKFLTAGVLSGVWVYGNW